MEKSKWEKKCKKCGKGYWDMGFGTDRFCGACGNELPRPRPPKKCICGRTINEENSFCSGCGKEIIKKTIKKEK